MGVPSAFMKLAVFCEERQYCIWVGSSKLSFVYDVFE